MGKYIIGEAIPAVVKGGNMEFTLVPIDEATAREVVSWRYSGQYALYNVDGEEAEEEIRILADPRYAYFAVYEVEKGALWFLLFRAGSAGAGRRL